MAPGGKEEILYKMSPIEFGGERLTFVYEHLPLLEELPLKFEAGTPNMAGASFLCAISIIEELGMTR